MTSATSSSLMATNLAPTVVQESRRPRIVHLAQTHWVKEKPSNNLPRIWASQKNIADYLMAHPNAMIFNEGELVTYGYPDLPADVRSDVCARFENVNFADLKSLSAAQKRFFARSGAVAALQLLNKLHRPVHRVMSPAQYDGIESRIQAEYRKGNYDTMGQVLRPLVFDQTEQALE